MIKDSWIVFEDIDALSEQLASDILNVAKVAIKSRG